MEREEEERFMFSKIQEKIEEERAKLLADRSKKFNVECNPSTSVCVRWESESVDVQSRGKGVAYRYNEDNIAEVKTEGYSSNTLVTIVHNDASASLLLGDGSPGGNQVYIKQNSGVYKKK